MVNFAKLSVGTAVLAAQLALGAPQAAKRQDSAIGDEVGVSAPDGIPITNTKELASQKSAEASLKSEAANTYATTTAEYTNAYTTQASWDTTTANVYDTTSVAYETTSAAVYDTTSVAYDTTSAAVYDTTSVAYNTYNTYNTWDTTSTTYTAAATQTYGSGSSNWGNSGYNDCVQQCIASFGAPAATYTPPSVTESAGTGVTHTIIVAPTQGVLRYVPFATNASVGDTIKFMWNANVHTVTQGSQIEICNKTSDSFASGVQNKSFVFTKVVNTTDPTFFYCAVPTHCQKGMFGIVNAPNADSPNINSSVNAMMPSLVSNSSEVSAWNAYTTKVAGGSKAANWGGNFDMANVPGWAQEVFVENVMYTRNFLAMNPDLMKEDGSVDLSASSAPWMFPQDLNSVLAASSPSASSGPAATNSASGSDSPAATNSPSAANGARSLTSSFGLASVVALGAALFAL